MLTDLPPKKNSPPRIVTVDPASPVPVKLGLNCKVQQFRVVVEDPDVGDPIRNKWFTELDPLGLGGTTLAVEDAGTRSKPVQPPSTLFSATSIYATNRGKHKLTVVIADGEFSEGDTLVERVVGTLKDGGVQYNPAYTDSYTWDIDTSDGTPCP